MSKSRKRLLCTALLAVLCIAAYCWAFKSLRYTGSLAVGIEPYKSVRVHFFSKSPESNKAYLRVFAPLVYMTASKREADLDWDNLADCVEHRDTIYIDEHLADYADYH